MQSQPLLKLYVPLSQDHPSVLEGKMNVHSVRASGSEQTKDTTTHICFGKAILPIERVANTREIST